MYDVNMLLFVRYEIIKKILKTKQNRPSYISKS